MEEKESDAEMGWFGRSELRIGIGNERMWNGYVWGVDGWMNRTDGLVRKDEEWRFEFYFLFEIDSIDSLRWGFRDGVWMGRSTHSCFFVYAMLALTIHFYSWRLGIGLLMNAFP